MPPGIVPPAAATSRSRPCIFEFHSGFLFLFGLFDMDATGRNQHRNAEYNKNTKQTVQAEGVVVHSKEGVYMGIQFSPLQEAYANAMAKYIEDKSS